MDGTSDRTDRPASALTHMGQYVVEEWAEEYRDGHLSRREFLRRIGVFSGGAALAGAVLAAVGMRAS
ncbi:MAG TPA: hypothetical protein VEZ44_02285, partial [bacterium]|nr:hypothetical protein [bacterium]